MDDLSSDSEHLVFQNNCEQDIQEVRNYVIFQVRPFVIFS